MADQQSPCHMWDDGTKLTAALYGLMIKDAMNFYRQSPYIDQQYWNNLDPVTRDAIFVTYCSIGKAQVIENILAEKAKWEATHNEPFMYQPKPGRDATGGENHIYNACRVGRAMLDPSYGGCGLPKCTILDPVTCKPRKVDCLPPPPGPPVLTPLHDPLILDLDGDGIQTTSVNGRAHFDQDANGFAEQTGWVSPSDGLLVLDRNGDDFINDGRELFGDQTILKSGVKAQNGFQALAELDANGDGKIDEQDTVFSQLRVWKDFNGDGFSFPNELFTLDELGIKSINLDSTMVNITDKQGNFQNMIGSFERLDGTTGQEAEVKIEAFPYTKYGTIRGEVKHVSCDAIQDEKKGLIYSSRVKVGKSSILVENKPVTLSAGMAVTVEIKTGKRRVIEYFLTPLIQHTSESLRER
jgi:hypothetical protein